ncbi:MAG: polysaccharide deacetylase family protein [Bacillota bacterium]
MSSLLVLFFLSIITGALPVIIPKTVKRAYRSSANAGQSLVKALLIFYLAKYLVGTPVSMAVAGVGVILGQIISYQKGFYRGSVRVTAAGFLILITPEAAVPALILWLLLRRLLPRWGPLIVSVLLPLITWATKGTDIYIIQAAFLGSVGVYLDFPLLEKVWRPWTRNSGFRRYWSRERFPGLAKIKTRRFFARFLVFLFVFLLAMGIFLNKYVYRGFGMQVDVFRMGTEDFKLVALTFDDGPDPLYTQQILDILGERDIMGTFFLLGRHVENYPEIARRIVDEGHEIGNHTYSHYNMLKAPPARIEEEIVKGEEAIERVTGERPALFRPPRGVYDANTQKVLRERGYNLILWSLSSRDWLEISARDIHNNIMARAKPGEIILFHDSGNLFRSSGGSRLNTVTALPTIIDELERQGYSFVTVTQMMIISGLTGGD